MANTDHAAVLVSRETDKTYESTICEGQADDDLQSGEFWDSQFSTAITEIGQSVYKSKTYETTFVRPYPCPTLNTVQDSLLWTKPKLLRKKEAELSRCRELLSKREMDCANAVSGERFARERQAELRRRLNSQRSEFEALKRVERLRFQERLVRDTDRLRRERDEVKVMLTAQDLMIKRLKIRVRQLEQVEKRRQQEFIQMKREMDAKDGTLKNLLRKLVLAEFGKKKS